MSSTRCGDDPKWPPSFMNKFFVVAAMGSVDFVDVPVTEGVSFSWGKASLVVEDAASSSGTAIVVVDDALDVVDGARHETSVVDDALVAARLLWWRGNIGIPVPKLRQDSPALADVCGASAVCAASVAPRTAPRMRRHFHTMTTQGGRASTRPTRAMMDSVVTLILLLFPPPPPPPPPPPLFDMVTIGEARLLLGLLVGSSTPICFSDLILEFCVFGSRSQVERCASI
ncbi:hypothetical protein PGQ11_009622 [Apiospora arundinis]|uniref:Uncharacterized protein n=1 Tax=Apiospora arundinis TaxID=335852 RepID=A0ABR2IIG7_9PEZI